MERASFKKIQKLLEISERERHHEILLTARNLRELSRSPSSYIIPIIPRPLPTEAVEGEHYVIADLLNLTPGSWFPAKNLEIEAFGLELVISTQPGQHSLAREDSGLAPQASKKGRWVPERLRAPGAGVEDFVSWVSPISSHLPVSEEEEEEDEG